MVSAPESVPAIGPEALLAPWSVEDLRAMLREGLPRQLSSGDPDRFASLFDWQALLDLVLSGEYPQRKLQITRGGRRLPSVFQNQGAAPDPVVIERLMASGGSLVLYNIDPYVPSLARLCAALAESLGEKVIISAVGTTGSGGALTPHFDKGDVLVLQVEGSKRWMLHGDPVPGAIPGMSGALPDPDAPVLMDVTLTPGDLLFVPAGQVHHCENCGDRSLHLAFLIYPLTAPRVIELMFRSMIEEPEARRAFRNLSADRAAHEAALRELIRSRLDRMRIDELIATHQASDYLAPIEKD